MKRLVRLALERELMQTRRLSLEPSDLRTRERLAEAIEELELQLREGSLEAEARVARHNHYTGIIL